MPDYDGTEMCSYAIDVWPEQVSLLTDEVALLALLRATAAAGHAVVLGESHHRFPNGAVTAVLVLSQSHLSVHTWPEHGSANVDLLTCGRLNGELMITYLMKAMPPIRCDITRTNRTVRARSPVP